MTLLKDTIRKTAMAVAAAAALFAAAAGAVSCEKYVLPSVVLSQDSVLVNNAAQQLSIVVNSNVIWDFDMDAFDADWVTLDPEYGDMTATVTLSIAANETGALRRVTIPVKSETLSRNLYVIQSADGCLPQL